MPNNVKKIKEPKSPFKDTKVTQRPRYMLETKKYSKRPYEDQILVETRDLECFGQFKSTCTHSKTCDRTNNLYTEH